MRPKFAPSTEAADAAAASKRWSVACAASLMNLLQTGAFFFTPTTLMPLLVADFGLDLAVSTVPIAVGKIAYVLLLVPGGMLVDVFGPRRCVIVGIAGLAAFLTLYAIFVNSLSHVIVAHICLATVSSISGVPVYSLFIAQWFEARVGLAMGLVLAGYSAAGTAVPSMMGPIATEFGWRAAMGVMAAVLWLIGLPLAITYLQEKPEPEDFREYFQEDQPEEYLPLLPPAESNVSLPALSSSANALSLLETLEQRPVDNKSWTFVGFSLNYMLLQYAFGCFGENILFFLTIDRGYSLSLASLLFSSLNLASFCAKLVGGHLGDHYDRFHVASATSALAGLGTVFLFVGGGLSEDNVPRLTTSPIALVLFSILFGFGYGATFNCLYVLVPLVFGKQNLGRIQSTLFGVGLIGNATGSILTGILRSRFGTYDRPFLVAGASCLTNFLVFNVTRLSLGWSIPGLKYLSAETEPVLSSDLLVGLHDEDDAIQRVGSSSDVCGGLANSYGAGSRMRGSGFFDAVFKSSPSVEQFLMESGSPRRGGYPVPVPDNEGVMDLGSAMLALSPDASGPSFGATSPPASFAESRSHGVEFESGFPFARDWSSNSLIRHAQGSRRQRRRRGVDVTPAESPPDSGLMRTSSTLENLIESGILSSSLEDIGYVGNFCNRPARSPSAERMLSSYSPSRADAFRDSPVPRMTPENNRSSGMHARIRSNSIPNELGRPFALSKSIRSSRNIAENKDQ